MSSGAAGTMPQSVLPGFPGASHLYHIGATDFFLDHPQHIALTTEQQAALNKAKEQALLAKSTADRAIEQADQELWTLTAADQPDAAKIEAKITEIEKLRGDERLAFIRAVGEASKLLTDEQRKILTGFAAARARDVRSCAGCFTRADEGYVNAQTDHERQQDKSQQMMRLALVGHSCP